MLHNCNTRRVNPNRCADTTNICGQIVVESSSRTPQKYVDIMMQKQAVIDEMKVLPEIDVEYEVARRVSFIKKQLLTSG